MEGVERHLDIARAQLLGTAHGAKVLDGLGDAPAQRHQHLVGHDPLAGDVAVLGAMLAPGGELAGDGELTARAGVDALDALERGAGIAAIVGGIGQRPDLIAHPRGASQGVQLGLDHPVRVNEVADVVDRVLDLLG